MRCVRSLGRHWARFHTAQFGWRRGPEQEAGNDRFYERVSLDGRDAAGIRTDSALEQPAWVIHFRVDGIRRAAERIQAGGTLAEAPTAMPGGAWSVQALDPEGVRFALTGAA